MSGDEKPAVGLAVALRQTEQALHRRLSPHLAALGLGMDHWRILAVLQARPGLTMSAVAGHAVVPAATLTRHVDTLVAVGLVVRRVDAADRRRAVTALSPRGWALAATLTALESEVAHDLENTPIRPLLDA